MTHATSPGCQGNSFNRESDSGQGSLEERLINFTPKMRETASCRLVRTTAEGALLPSSLAQSVLIFFAYGEAHRRAPLRPRLEFRGVGGEHSRRASAECRNRAGSGESRRRAWDLQSAR